MATIPVGGARKPVKPTGQAEPSPFALQGKGGRKFNIPGAVWAGVPETERAGLQDAFKRGGISALRAASTGKPYGQDLSQAIAGARGAVQNKPGARPAATGGQDVAPKASTGVAPPMGVPAPAPESGPIVAPPSSEGAPMGVPNAGGPPPVVGGAPEADGGGVAGGVGVPSPAPVAQSPYLTMQGGKGGYSVPEWEGLKAFIATQPPNVQAQIMAGIDAVPGAGGQKFDFLLGQIKKYAGGGQGVPAGAPDTNPPVPGQAPAPRPDVNVPQGAIVNNWKPNDPEWIKAMDAKFGQGHVMRVQQAMNEAVKGMPEDGSGRRRAAIYAVLQKFGMIPGSEGQPPGPTPQQPPLGGGGQDPYSVPPSVTSQTGAPPPIYTPPVLTQTQQGPQTQQVNPATGLPNIFVPF